MATPPTEQSLAEFLPGRWTIAATNFPHWLSGERSRPTFTYTLVRSEPLVLMEDVSWATIEGSVRHLRGTDRWGRGGFVLRRRGHRWVLPVHWTVASASEDRSVVVLRFAKSIATPAGITIMLEDGTPHPELRAAVAHGTDHFGLTAEEFATLAWLP